MTRGYTPEDPYSDWGPTGETAEDFFESLEIILEKIDHLDASDPEDVLDMRREIKDVAQALKESDLSEGEQKSVSALLARVREAFKSKTKKKS